MLYLGFYIYLYMYLNKFVEYVYVFNILNCSQFIINILSINIYKIFLFRAIGNLAPGSQC